MMLSIEHIVYGLIKINVHYILIIIECHVYIVVLNVLYDDVYMYKSLQIKCLSCSVYNHNQFDM